MIQSELERTIMVIFTKNKTSKTVSPILSRQMAILLEKILHQIIQKSNSFDLYKIKQSISYFFEGGLLENVCKEGEYYLLDDRYKEFVLDVSVIEKHLHLIFPTITIHKPSIFYLCGVLEYLMVEFIDLTHIQSIKASDSTVLYVHLQRAIQSDKELLLMCSRFHIRFVGLDEEVFEYKETKKLLKMMDIHTNKKTEWFIHKYLETYISNVLRQTIQTCTHFNKSQIDFTDLELIFRQMEHTN